METTLLEEKTVTERERTGPVGLAEEFCPVPAISELEKSAPAEEIDTYGTVLSCCCEMPQR